MVERDAARVVLLDPQDRVLLQEISSGQPGRQSFWVMPGGGLAPGETHEEAALRELREEIGVVSAELGPCVWVREHEFVFRGTSYRQRERFFLARAGRFEIDTRGLDPIEVEVVLSHRWWGLDEIQAAHETLFAPKLLGLHLAPLIEGRIPEQPIDVGA